MHRHIYHVNDDGYIIESYLGVFDENDKLSKVYGFERLPDKPFVTVELPQPLIFIKPRWNGTEWIEGETEEEKAEREAQQLLESLKPTPSEIANAELEIKIATMLTELEVTQ